MMAYSIVVTVLVGDLKIEDTALLAERHSREVGNAKPSMCVDIGQYDFPFGTAIRV